MARQNEGCAYHRGRCERAKRMRKDKPFIFTNMKTGDGLAQIIEFIEHYGLFKS